MHIDNKFDLGQIVYLKTDTEQIARMVTAINTRPSRLQYELSYATNSSWHDEIEISDERDVLKSIS